MKRSLLSAIILLLASAPAAWAHGQRNQGVDRAEVVAYRLHEAARALLDSVAHEARQHRHGRNSAIDAARTLSMSTQSFYHQLDRSWDGSPRIQQAHRRLRMAYRNAEYALSGMRWSHRVERDLARVDRLLERLDESLDRWQRRGGYRDNRSGRPHSRDRSSDWTLPLPPLPPFPRLP